MDVNCGWTKNLLDPRHSPSAVGHRLPRFLVNQHQVDLEEEMKIHKRGRQLLLRLTQVGSWVPASVRNRTSNVPVSSINALVVGPGLVAQIANVTLGCGHELISLTGTKERLTGSTNSAQLGYGCQLARKWLCRDSKAVFQTKRSTLIATPNLRGAFETSTEKTLLAAVTRPCPTNQHKQYSQCILPSKQWTRCRG